MSVFITGGSGFVGRHLTLWLQDQGYEVTVLSRSEEHASRLPPGVKHIIGDPTQEGPWQEQAAGHDVFVNLAGASIFSRWTKQYKKIIRDSRVLTTRSLVKALTMRQSQEPAVLVSTSAVGFYGNRGDEEISEDSPPGKDFLAQVCKEWEAAALEAEVHGARVVRARFGIVLGRRGGALEIMLTPFRLGAGGRLGSGRQWFSWIHQADLAAALAFCIKNPQISGAVNCTAPNPVTNRELTKALARQLKRPAILPAPAFMIKLILGEFGSLLLEGQRVLPGRLVQAGFQYRFPALPQALADLLD